MKKVILSMLIGVFMFTGCTGAITGLTYDPVIAYQVVKNGVTIMMTEEQIKQAGLDKANLLVTGTYEIIKQNTVQSDLNETANIK